MRNNVTAVFRFHAEVCANICSARKHADDLLHALRPLHGTHTGLNASAAFGLFNQEVLVGEGGDLGQVGDAQHLLGAGQRLQLGADRLRCAAANADVDFVEDQGARQGSLPAAGGGVVSQAASV